MLKRVILALDSVNSASWTQHDVGNICEFLTQQFPQFPDTGRIYHGDVCQENDVTPTCEEDIERLLQLPGPFFVVVYPGWAALPYVFAVLVAAAAYILAPSPVIPPPAVLARNQQTSSPNNELSDRSNRARINGRIPDIFGTVRSTPDLIAAPYKIFENNKEVEYAYMCIGRGSYEVSDIRDGETQCINIPGTSVEVFGPYTSPNSGDDPELRVGTKIQSKVLKTTRSNSVNGQVLRPPNTSTLVGDSNIRFIYPNRIVADEASTIDFTSHFFDGDLLTISGASQAPVSSISEERQLTLIGTQNPTLEWPSAGLNVGGGLVIWTEYFSSGTPVAPLGYDVGAEIVLTQHQNPYYDGSPPPAQYYPANFSGTYEIEAVSFYQLGYGAYYVIIKLVDPASVNAAWDSYSNDLVVWGGENNFEVQLDATVPGFDLDGTYTVVAVTSKEITLDDPGSVNGDWLVLDGLPSSPYMSPTLSTEGQKWIGPFILEDDDADSLFANFVAVNGLYKDDGTTQEAEVVSIQVEATPVDEADEPIGTPALFQINIRGSDSLKETVAVTMKEAFGSFTGRCAVRASRLSPTDTAFAGNVVDEVRWRDLYSVSPVTETDFGNVTTVNTVTFATASALAVKERRLNMLVTRKIPLRVSGSTFSTDLTATDDAAEIFAAVCRDLYIGRRSAAEMDFDNIYDTVDAVETYFGTAKARKFSYTFDNDNLSFEETASQVADALHCVAYRRGNVIRLSFEKETDDSTLLFNHRNKIPKTERRSVTFGKIHEYDGLEYTYVDPRDDSIISIFLPPTYAASNPKKVESIGIRDHLQAYFLAWRIWNKMLYQNTTVEFDATQEADLLVRNDRILVADGTRPYTQDGEVVAVDSLELTLSQDVDLTQYASYVIFLQHIDGIAESIAISAGSASNKVVLAGAPRLALVTDIESYARTAYVIVGSTEPAQTAFLMTEREPQGGMTSTVRAKNYDARYYANDLDFINDIIGENGYGRTGGFTPGTGNGFPPSGGGGGPPTFLFYEGASTTGVVIHDGTQFVVLARQGSSNHECFSSGNGTSWSAEDATIGMEAVLDMIHHAGLYIGVGSNGGNEYVSTGDLSSWNSASGLPDGSGQGGCSCIRRHNGAFMIGATISSFVSTAPLIYTSATGSSWTNLFNRSHNSDIHGVHDIAFDGASTFVLVASSSEIGQTGLWSASASNLTLWTLRQADDNLSSAKIDYGNGVFVALTEDTAYTSSNGTSWTANAITPPGSPRWMRWVAARGQFVAIFRSLVTDEFFSGVSSDGVSWTYGTAQDALSAGPRSIAHDAANDVFVTVANAV